MWLSGWLGADEALLEALRLLRGRSFLVLIVGFGPVVGVDDSLDA